MVYRVVRICLFLSIFLMVWCSFVSAGVQVFKLTVKYRTTGETVEVSGGMGASITLPGGAELILEDYTESYDTFGPAAKIRINPTNVQKGTPFVILQNFPQFDERRGGKYIVSLLEVDQ